MALRIEEVCRKEYDAERVMAAFKPNLPPSDVPTPFGIGFHLYLTVGTPVVDDSLLTIPARRWLVTDDPTRSGRLLEGELGNNPTLSRWSRGKVATERAPPLWRLSRHALLRGNRDRDYAAASDF